MMKKLGFLLLFVSSGIVYGMSEVKRSLTEKYAQEERHRAVSNDSFLRNLRRQSNQPHVSTNLKTNAYSNVANPTKCGSGSSVRRKNKHYTD